MSAAIRQLLRRPIVSASVFFLEGSSLSVADLHRCDIRSAQACLLLPDSDELLPDPDDEYQHAISCLDRRVILRALTVRMVSNGRCVCSPLVPLADSVALRLRPTARCTLPWHARKTSTVSADWRCSARSSSPSSVRFCIVHTAPVRGVAAR